MAALGTAALVVRRRRLHRALLAERTAASLVLVDRLERFHRDPAAFLAEARAAPPRHDEPPLRDGEQVLHAVRTTRRQWTQTRDGVLVITTARLFFDPVEITTNWTRTWPSIDRFEAGEDHLRVHLANGGTVVFEFDPADPDAHPGLVQAICDHAQAEHARALAALPTAGA